MTLKAKSPQIDDQAAEWVARIDAGPLEPAEEARLNDWLDADPRHLGAFAKAHAVLLHSDRARALGPTFDPAAFIAADTAEQPVTVSRRRLLRMGSIAAGIGALAAGGGMLFFAGMQPSYATRIGETRVIPLQDGSVVTLNTDSEISVRFSAELRLIHLIRGEALFDVAKNKRRPFIVDADGTSVRAVGTSFTVELLPGRPVQVMVREGVVEVKRAGETATAPVKLAANTRAITPKDAPILAQKIATAEVTRALSWRVGRLAFEGETLADAAAIFARYSETKIVIDDPAVARKTITGLYVSNDPVGFSRAVAMSLDLHSELRGSEVHITP